MSFCFKYLDEATQIIQELDRLSIDEIIRLLVDLREKEGRLFFWESAVAPDTRLMQSGISEKLRGLKPIHRVTISQNLPRV